MKPDEIVTPRDGYGYCIIRMDNVVAQTIATFLSIKKTDVQGFLEDQGVFEEVKRALILPDEYQVHGIFFDVNRFVWNILVEVPGIPAPDAGEFFPTVVPYYHFSHDGEATRATLLRVEVVEPSHCMHSD